MNDREKVYGMLLYDDRPFPWWERIIRLILRKPRWSQWIECDPDGPTLVEWEADGTIRIGPPNDDE